MDVIADTSPLNYLVLIRTIEVLPALYGAIVVPPAVVRELRDASAPEIVRRWAESTPVWLSVAPPPPIDEGLRCLDSGEREAIAAAKFSGHEVLLLMDDARGRAEAERRAIRTTGTLGVLVAASRKGLLDLGTALEALQRTNFRISPKLVSQLLAAERTGT